MARTRRAAVPLRWETGAQDAADLTFDGTLELKPLSQHLAGLAIVGAYAVQPHVEWGEVTLTGSTELHSDAADLAARLDNIDGVVAVHNHVEWQEDDVGKLPLGYPDSA